MLLVLILLFLLKITTTGLSMEEVRKDLAEAISGFESREKIHLLNYRFALNLLLAERLRLCGELRSAAHAYEKSIRWARKGVLLLHDRPYTAVTWR